VWQLSITPPEAEPLDLNTEVAQHLRLEPAQVAAQATVLQGQIAAAREECETATGRQLIETEIELWLDNWYEEGIYSREPCDRPALFLPVGQVSSVDEITYIDTDGVVQVWDDDLWTASIPTGEKAGKARIFPAWGEIMPPYRPEPASIKVTFTAGYGTSFEDVPLKLRQGMLLYLGELYERREEATVGTIVTPNVLRARQLWWSFRVR
jgi:uncharacterized phiE125 gp8 family phage protein